MLKILSLLLAFSVSGNTAYANSSAYAKQLGAKVSEVVEHQPQLNAMLKHVRENGDYDVWFAGGTAVSVLTYAQSLMEAQKPVPKVVHWFDVFLPGQDADFAIDTTFENVKWFQGSIENVASDSELGMDIKVQDRSAWEFVTLREENGRGYVGSKKLFLQSSDTLSLGLFKLNSHKGVDFRYAPSFDENSNRVENHFLDDIRKKRIRYLRKDSHRRSDFYKEGRNPEFISVLRVLNKMSRYGLSTDAESMQSMLDVVHERLDKPKRNLKKDEEYVHFRALKIAKGALIGSIDPVVTSKLFQQLRVYELLKSSGVDADVILELQRSEKFFVRNKSSVSLRNRERIPINKVFRLPDSAVVEGTTLFGGERPPAMVDRSTAEYGVYLAEGIEILANKSLNANEKAKQLSNIVNQYSDDVFKGDLNSPIHYLTDSEAKCSSDCRDYSILAHLLLSELGLPAIIVSNTRNTNVIVQLGSRKFVLEHYGGTTTPNLFRVEYIQNVWVNPGDNLDPKPVDLQRVYLREWLRNLDNHFSDGIEESISRLEKFIGKRSDLKLEFFKAIAKKIQERSFKVVLGWGSLRGLFPEGVSTVEFESASNRVFDDVFKAETVKARAERLFHLLDVKSGVSHNLVRIPEDQRLLSLLDEILDDKNFKFADNYVRAWFCEMVLIAAQNWTSPPLREALFFKLLPYIDDHHSKLVTKTSWSEMLEPNPKWLMIARAFDLSGKKFFYSKSVESYLGFSLSEAKELLHYDKRFTLAPNGSLRYDDNYLELFKALYQAKRMDLVGYFFQVFRDSPPHSVRSQDWFKYLAFEIPEEHVKLIVDDLLALANNGEKTPLNIPADASVERYELLSGVEFLTRSDYLKADSRAIANASLQYNYLAKLLNEPKPNSAKVKAVFSTILPILFSKEFALSDRVVSDLLHSKVKVVQHIGPELTDSLINKIQTSDLDADSLISTIFVLLKQREKLFSNSSFDDAVGFSSSDLRLLSAMKGYVSVESLNVNELFNFMNRWFAVRSLPPMEWVSLATMKHLRSADLVKISDENMRHLVNELETRVPRHALPILLRLKDHPYFLSESFVFNHRKFISSMFSEYIESSSEMYHFLKYLQGIKPKGMRQVPVLSEFASLALRRVNYRNDGTLQDMVRDLKLGNKTRDFLLSAISDSRGDLREKLKVPTDLGLDSSELSRKFCQIYLRQLR